jgi:predicted nucleic acid-binding protein
VSEIIRSANCYIDTTIYIECLQGSKSNTEKRLIKNFLDTFPLLPITEDVSMIAIELIDKYSNSHGLLLPDAFIASSAIRADLTLLTFNVADFQFIRGLRSMLPGADVPT